MHPTASLSVNVGMAGVALAVVVALVAGYARALRGETFREDLTTPAAIRRSVTKFACGLAVWLLLLALLAFSGVLRRVDLRPPPFAGVMFVGFALTIATACSRIGTRLAEGLPIAWLVGFQAFRLPLELVMHRAATEGTMPVQMSFGGANFDIVTGITAIVVATLVARGMAPRWLVVAWCVLGSVLLAVIVAIAFASLPGIAAFGDAPERLNTWVAWFPFVWLPGVLVLSALFGHIVLFRRLLADAREPHTPTSTRRTKNAGTDESDIDDKVTAPS